MNSMRIQIEGLTKIYGKKGPPALNDLNLEIRHGTFGLLGPNGAGKTTLIQILSTQMSPSAGKVMIDEWDLQKHRTEVRSRLGYLPQHFGAYPKLTAQEFLDYMARLAGRHGKTERLESITSALESVGLYEDRNRRTGTYSGGMMRRLGIAQAILADPEFLIVDEPTVGLDPEERIRFRSILGRLSRDRAILISTHIVGDISSTCEDIAVLDFGKLIYHGSPEGLVSLAEGKTWRVAVNDSAFAELSRKFHVVTVSVDGDQMNLRMVGDESPPEEAEAVSPNLEDAYVYFMGSDNRPPAST
jgi:ABC-type multidrug transport system ATPase subunit